jgi:hypothetical protein
MSSRAGAHITGIKAGYPSLITHPVPPRRGKGDTLLAKATE